MLDAIVFGLTCSGVLISLAFMIWFFSEMKSHVRPEKESFAYFLGPAIFFMSWLWDDEGNKARIKFLVAAACFIFCVVIGLTVLPILDL